MLPKMPIEKETFEGMDTNSKLGVLFDYTQQIYCKLEKLEGRKKTDKALSLFGGIMGGVLAVFGKWMFWK